MRMKRILNHLISGSGFPSGRDGSSPRPSVGAIRDRALYSVGADGGRADVSPRLVGAIRDRAEVSPRSVGAIRDRALYSVGADGGRALVNVRALGTRLQGISDLRPSSFATRSEAGECQQRSGNATVDKPSSVFYPLTSDLRPLTSVLCPPKNAGFSLIEVMVSAVLAIIVVWAAGTQIINVLRYHNEYRIDAILLEDLTRVANGVQSRIEMCTNWVSSASGGWEGGFPAQVNGVAFETNRFTNVTKYRIYTEESAFVEELIRKPAGNEVTNTIRRFVANEPGIVGSIAEVNFEISPTVDVVRSSAISMAVPKLVKSTFSTTAQWRWAGRTHTNTVTVPRMIMLYNKN